MSGLSELGGGTVNTVTLDTNTGIVSKSFNNGNGIARSPKHRLQAEIYSLKKIPVAPNFLGCNSTTVHMQHLIGENNLDVVTQNKSESARNNIYRTAGISLAKIHSCNRQVCHEGQVGIHKSMAVNNIIKVNGRLAEKGISTLQVIDYLNGGERRAEGCAKKTGLAWTYGDYWLNNLIGEISRGGFKLNGVIDWELAQVDTPFVDYAVAYLSIERMYPESSKPFWKGYGFTPDEKTKKYFAVMKTLQWIAADPQGDLNSDFYKDKIDFIKQETQK